MKGESPKRRKSFIGTFFKILLIILLAVIIAAVALIFVLKGGMKKQDIGPDMLFSEQKVCGDASEYLGFSEDRTMSLTLHDGDIAWMAQQVLKDNGGLTDALNMLGLELTGGNVSLDESGAVIGVEVYRKDTRLAVKIDAEVILDGEDICICPKRIDFGSLKISLDRLPGFIKLPESVSCVRFTPELCFISEITGISTGDGTLTVSGPLSCDYFAYNVKTPVEMRRMSLMQDGCSLAAPVLADWLEGESDCFKDILPKLVEDPVLFTVYLDQLCALFPEESEDNLAIETANFGLALRWYQTYDREKNEEARKELNKQYKIGVEFYDLIVNGVSNAWNTREITVRNGEFLYNREPFTVRGFYGENLIVTFDNYKDYLNVDENMCLCLISDEAYRDDNAPKLSRVIDSKKSLPEGTDTTRAYYIGAVTMGRDGNAYIMCRTYSNWTYTYNYIRISAGEYERIISSELIPVWDGNIA